MKFNLTVIVLINLMPFVSCLHAQNAKLDHNYSEFITKLTKYYTDDYLNNTKFYKQFVEFGGGVEKNLGYLDDGIQGVFLENKDAMQPILPKLSKTKTAESSEKKMLLYSLQRSPVTQLRLRAWPFFMHSYKYDSVEQVWLLLAYKIYKSNLRNEEANYFVINSDLSVIKNKQTLEENFLSILFYSSKKKFDSIEEYLMVGKINE